MLMLTNEKIYLTIAVYRWLFFILKFDSDTASVPEASMPDAISPPQISANLIKKQNKTNRQNFLKFSDSRRQMRKNA